MNKPYGNITPLDGLTAGSGIFDATLTSAFMMCFKQTTKKRSTGNLSVRARSLGPNLRDMFRSSLHLFFFSVLDTVPTNGVKNLTIGAYAPLTGPCWGGGFAVKIVIELALSQVNSRTDMLPGYQLNMVLNDTKVCAKKLSNVLCH